MISDCLPQDCSFLTDRGKERKLKSIENDRGGRRAPRFLEAANKLGLGEHDLAKIQWDKINMG